MPYIITTSEPFDADVHTHRPAFTRRAVATLEETHDHVFEEIWAAYGRTAGTNDATPALGQADALTESGGTIGPLPDGTVIEVERVDWDHVERAVVARMRRTWTNEQFIDAYNTKEV
jgi:hypothetical protein